MARDNRLMLVQYIQPQIKANTARARAAFGKYMSEEPGTNAAKKVGGPRITKDGEAGQQLTPVGQMSIAERIGRAETNSLGCRFLERCAGILGTTSSVIVTDLLSAAAVGGLFHAVQAATSPRSPDPITHVWLNVPFPVGFIVGAVLGLYLGSILAGGLEDRLKGLARDIKNRKAASLACDALLSGTVTDPAAV